MNLKKMLLLCLVTGAFCACNQGRETNATVTPAEISMTPVATPEPKGELIPIDEAYFTSEVFRRFLSVKYDTNQDGFLSQAEREAVKAMKWDPYEMEWEGIGTDHDEFTEAVLDGFEYFPYLEDLNVMNADKVIFKNHPAIRYVGGAEGGIGLLYMENCPSLESIGGYAYSGSVVVINCENLKGFQVRHSKFASLSFTGCPQLVLDFEEWNSVEELLLDADVVLTALPDGFYMIRKDEIPPWSGLTYKTIEWKNVAEQAVEMPEGEDFFFKYFDERDFAYMGVQVLEKIEDIYDEQGRKGWNICIDRKIDAYSKTAFSLYTEVPPEPEQIFVRPAGFEEVKMLEYSPNHGVSFQIIWVLEVVYAGSSGESVLGTMTEDQYWTVAADGTKTRYRSEWEWQKNGSRCFHKNAS